MSGAADILAMVPGIMADLFEVAPIEYRATDAAAWSLLHGVHLSPVRVLLTYDGDHHQEQQQEERDLSAARSAPVLAIGWQVKTSADAIWSIAAVQDDAVHGLRTYTLRRDPLAKRAPDRRSQR